MNKLFQDVEDTEFEDVRDFHTKFNQLQNFAPTHLTARKLANRANFMLEELLEFAEAAGLKLTVPVDGVSCPATVIENTPTAIVVHFTNQKIKFEPDPNGRQDLAAQADALIDLDYVAKGTGVMLGLPWRALWDDVHRANMAKSTMRGSDGILLEKIGKPKGWEPPHTEAILAIAGYETQNWFHPVTGNIVVDALHDDPGHLKEQF